jgi:Na+-transporting methylmalonyl-CoA/oxaloacetate decarboxylase gamma subunit
LKKIVAVACVVVFLVVLVCTVSFVTAPSEASGAVCTLPYGGVRFAAVSLMPETNATSTPSATPEPTQQPQVTQSTEVEVVAAVVVLAAAGIVGFLMNHKKEKT